MRDPSLFAARAPCVQVRPQQPPPIQPVWRVEAYHGAYEAQVAEESQRVNPPVQEDESERHQILEQPGAAQEQPERQPQPGGLPPRVPRRARANSVGGGSQGSFQSFGSNNQAAVRFQQFAQQNQNSNVTMQLSGGRGNIVDRDALDQALQNRIAEEENEDESQNVNEFNADQSPELPFHLQDPNMREPLRDPNDHDDG